MLETALSHQRQTRENLLKMARHYSREQLLHIPEGFRNNLLWNFAHVLVTQQRLCYGLSDQPLQTPDSWSELFGRGSQARNDYQEALIEEVKARALPLHDQVAEDYRAGRFRQFKPYQTSFGAYLQTIEEAIAFSGVHESLHLGYMMALRRLL